MIDEDEYSYLPVGLILWVARVTDSEFDSILWRDDAPDWSVRVCAMRDFELVLDLTGNRDSCA